jgi:hypothetical protein
MATRRLSQIETTEHGNVTAVPDIEIGSGDVFERDLRLNRDLIPVVGTRHVPGKPCEAVA